MEEQDDRKQHERNPNNQSPAPESAANAVGVDAKDPAAHTTEGGRNTDPIEKTLADRIRQAEIWMIILTAIIALSTAANVIVFYLESESTSKQIGILSSKAGQIVGTMNNALSDSRSAINNAFLENRRALDASRAQSKAGLEETKRSNQINREALVSVQRAFVTALPPGTFAPLIRKDQPQILAWQFHTNWENSGVTPTRGAITHISFLTLHSQLPKTFTFPDLGGTPTLQLVLGPKARIASDPMIVTGETLQDIQRGEQHLYFWGWIRYRDIFNGTKPHVTKFCYEVKHIVGELSIQQEHTIQLIYGLCTGTDRNNNCTDDECDGKPPSRRK